MHFWVNVVRQEHNMTWHLDFNASSLHAGRGFTCDFMLPELVVLVGLLHWFDGSVVDVQQLLHSS